MTTMQIVVNDRQVSWQDGNNSLMSCNGCGQFTVGRACLMSPNRSFSNWPYCMRCAMDQTLSGEIVSR